MLARGRNIDIYQNMSREQLEDLCITPPVSTPSLRPRLGRRPRPTTRPLSRPLRRPTSTPINIYEQKKNKNAKIRQFMSSKDIDEIRVIHSKSNNIEIMNGNQTDGIIEKII